jgi:hypothetical protein
MIKKEWLWINDLNKNKMDNNKLIAEFMGLSIKEGVSYYTDQDDMFFMGVEVEEPYLPFDEDCQTHTHTRGMFLWGRG